MGFLSTLPNADSYSARTVLGKPKKLELCKEVDGHQVSGSALVERLIWIDQIIESESNNNDNVDSTTQKVAVFALTSYEGIIELEPQLIFPQKMVDEANGLSGVKINTNFLGIAPKGMGLTAYLQYFSTAPLPIQESFSNMVRTQPVEVINYLLNPPTSLIDAAHQETEGVLDSYSASPPVPFMLPTGSVNLLGEIGAKTSLIMAPSNLTFTGTFTGTDAYVMALNNLLLLSLKERHTHGRGYQDHLTYKTTLKLKNLLLV